MPRIRSRASLFCIVALIAPLGACAGMKEAVKGPTLSPMGSPATQSAQTQQAISLAASSREAPPQPASANSLWRTGARAFFHDQRAGKVGDILTVLIQISDSAKTQNATNTSLTSANTLGIPNFFGLETLLAKITKPSSVISTNTSLVSAGSGGVNRQEQITLTVAAIVTQVLPNGNLVIQGSQEVKTNNDVRALTVTGIVRPEDITSSNTILHTQIAEARINYGGRGDISAVQKTPGGTALMQRYTPF
jgi:flagellar L-ring protein precursor FlgH